MSQSPALSGPTGHRTTSTTAIHCYAVLSTDSHQHPRVSPGIHWNVHSRTVSKSRGCCDCQWCTQVHQWETVADFSFQHLCIIHQLKQRSEHVYQGHPSLSTHHIHLKLSQTHTTKCTHENMSSTFSRAYLPSFSLVAAITYTFLAALYSSIPINYVLPLYTTPSTAPKLLTQHPSTSCSLRIF